jgi:signal peptidase complex subunit 2
MGKKKTKNDTAAEADSAADDAASAATQETPIQGYVEDELELLQVDLGDMIKMKQVLDESIAGAVLEHVEEEYSWDNFKLLLMFIACVFAMVAQFVPIPFPESRPVLGICGSAYFFLSGVLQFITTFVDKDAILLTRKVDKEDEKQKKRKNTDMTTHGLRVRSNLPRFSEWYTVVIEFQMDDKTKVSPKVEQTWSVGQFFDKEGYFDEVGLSQEVDALVKRFEMSQFDKDDDKKPKRE